MKYDILDLSIGESKSPTGSHYWHDPNEALEYLLKWYVPPRFRDEFHIVDEHDREWHEEELRPDGSVRQDTASGSGSLRRRYAVFRERIFRFVYRHLRRKNIGALERIIYFCLLLPLTFILLIDHQSNLFQPLFLLSGIGIIALSLLKIYDEYTNNIINKQKINKNKITIALFCIIAFLFLLFNNLS